MTQIINPLGGPLLPVNNVTFLVAYHHRPVAEVCNLLSEHFTVNHNSCRSDVGIGEFNRKIIKRQVSPHRQKKRSRFCYAHSLSFQHKLSKKYKSDNAAK